MTLGAPAFLDKVEALLGEKTLEYALYGRRALLLNIFSYEGEVVKLLDQVKSQKISSNYYDWKYAALSLIYRAVDGVDGIGSSIAEYLTAASRQDGIIGMLNRGNSISERTELLLSCVGLLKEIASFHIGAATRSRYAKAAYYMCVMREIFVYLNREDEFRSYFNDIIAQNSRRPALRDEMSIVYGKQATLRINS
jgi:hypothetical protein